MTAVESLAAALVAHQQAAYYQKFLRDNKILGPLVDSYIDGVGRRPTDQEIGQNRYARGLVLTEDARRALVAATVPPAVPGQLAGYDTVVLVPGELVGVGDGMWRGEAFVAAPASSP